MPDKSLADFHVGFRFPPPIPRRPHCQRCGCFISLDEAAETSGKVNDVHRDKCLCRKCQRKEDGI